MHFIYLVVLNSTKDDIPPMYLAYEDKDVAEKTAISKTMDDPEYWDDCYVERVIVYEKTPMKRRKATRFGKEK